VFWFKRILIILAALIALPVVGVLILDLYVRVQVALFYKAHPMLRTMNEAPPLITRGDDSWPQMRAVLLERIPIGSARSEAVPFSPTKAWSVLRSIRQRGTCRVRSHTIPSAFPVGMSK
jgi:hypothetical protein